MLEFFEQFVTLEETLLKSGPNFPLPLSLLLARMRLAGPFAEARPETMRLTVPNHYPKVAFLTSI